MQSAAALLAFLAGEMEGTAAAQARLLQELVATGTSLSAGARDVLDLIGDSLQWPEVPFQTRIRRSP